MGSVWHHLDDPDFRLLLRDTNDPAVSMKDVVQPETTADRIPTDYRQAPVNLFFPPKPFSSETELVSWTSSHEIILRTSPQDMDP